MTHLDTSFLVDLLREAHAGAEGPAHAVLTSLEGEELAISVYVACELYAGAELASDPQVERARITALIKTLSVVHTGDSFAPLYGVLLAELRRRGEAISTMDLLIATTARSHDASIVTRNVRDFERVPGLTVVTY